MQFSRMWRCVFLVLTDISEERIASIFRVEKSATEEPTLTSGCVFDWWLSVQPLSNSGSSLADFSTLKIEAICSSEKSVYTRPTRRHIPEDGILHSRRCEHLKSYMTYSISQESKKKFKDTHYNVPRIHSKFS
jgi:hypothetical protein